MHAENFCPSEEDCRSYWFEAKADYLYFQPFFNNDYIANPNGDDESPFNLQPGGPGKKNDFNFASGYRLNALYGTSNSLINGAGLRLTHLPAHHTKKINFPSSLPFSTATSDHSLTYYAAELFATVPIFEVCRLSFSIQPGLHYAFMTFRSSLEFPTLGPILKEKSQTWGIGPELALNLNYQFCDWLALKGDLIGGLLVSKAKAHFQMGSSSQGAPLTSGNPKTLTKVFPFWETSLAACLSFCIGSHQVDVEIGYEYLTYPNFIDRIQFPSNGNSIIDNVFSNFDFQGPYVSLSYSF